MYIFIFYYIYIIFYCIIFFTEGWEVRTLLFTFKQCEAELYGPWHPVGGGPENHRKPSVRQQSAVWFPPWSVVTTTWSLKLGLK